MSYIQYTVHCVTCNKYFNTAFGMQGMTLMWDPVKICPKCKGDLVKVSDGWMADDDNNLKK
jgi:hypothetical protein